MSNVPGFEHGPQTYYDEDIDADLTIVPTDDYRVLHKDEVERRRKYAKRAEAINSGGIRSYVTAYHGPVRKLNDFLEINEIGAVMKLLPYMRFEKNGDLMLESKRMGIREIAKVIGKAQRWTEALVATLTRLGVLIASKDVRRNVYRISDAYHTIGHVLKDTPYTKIYQTKTRADVKQISIQAAGLLYKMIPFIHYEKLYLCCNPNERDTEAIRHLSQSRLAAEINVDDGTVSRCMRELLRAGFVMRYETFCGTVIMMNPDVMFRKKYDDDDYTEYVRDQFVQAQNAAIDTGYGSVDIDIADLPF